MRADQQDEHGLSETSLTRPDGWVEVFPAESNGIKTVWRWSRAKAQENLHNVAANKKRDGAFLVVEKFRVGTERDSLVLDSFAGSGTTAHDKREIEYKKRVPDPLAGAPDCGTMTVRSGPAKGVFRKEDLPTALAGPAWRDLDPNPTAPAGRASSPPCRRTDTRCSGT